MIEVVIGEIEVVIPEESVILEKTVIPEETVKNADLIAEKEILDGTTVIVVQEVHHINWMKICPTRSFVVFVIQV